MPINACTINSFTIDGLNCLLTLPTRPPTPLTPQKGHPYHTSIDYAAYIVRMKERAAEEEYATEGPTISVKINVADIEFLASADNQDNQVTPLIFVSGIDVTENKPIEMEVGDIEIIRGRKLNSISHTINTIKKTGENKNNA